MGFGRGCVVGLVCLLLPWNATGKEGWNAVLEEDGIAVAHRTIPGESLPEFRGRVTVNAGMADVIAVLVDAPRRVEWTHKCVESYLVEDRGQAGRVSYLRTDAPWPVSDRDMALLSKGRVENQGNRIVFSFRNIPHAEVPVRKDVVRIPKMAGHYVVENRGEQTTFVEYRVHVNPGGSLPDWLAERAGRELPLKTLDGLRKQVDKTMASGVYRERLPEIEQWRKGETAVENP